MIINLNKELDNRSRKNAEMMNHI